MEVVNVKVAHLRPKYANLAEWMKDDNNEYIGRGGIVFINGERFPKRGSEWANPYRVKSTDQEDALAKYEKHLDEMLKDESCKSRFLKLKGKTLGCWCVSSPSKLEDGEPIICHGQIILKKLRELE